MTMSEEEKKELVQFILDKREEGKIVVMGLEGPMSMPLEDIIKQSAEGLLYDLNRQEETALTFIDDPKWVNDFAVALVIRKLKAENERLQEWRQKVVPLLEYAGKQGTVRDAEEWLDSIEALVGGES